MTYTPYNPYNPYAPPPLNLGGGGGYNPYNPYAPPPLMLNQGAPQQPPGAPPQGQPPGAPPQGQPPGAPPQGQPPGVQPHPWAAFNPAYGRIQSDIQLLKEKQIDIGLRPTDNTAAQWDVADARNREVQSQIDQLRDQLLIIEQTDKHLVHDALRHQATLGAQTANQYAALSLQGAIASDRLRFDRAGLQLQRDLAADEQSYRQQLLKQEEQKFAFESEERQRVREQTAEQFSKQLAQQKEFRDKTLAFNKDRADKEDARRVRAETAASKAAQSQVLSSLGFTQSQAKTRSPLEGLLLQGGRRQRARLQPAPR